MSTREPSAPVPHQESHPLLRYLMDAAEGIFPPVDGGVTVLPPLARGMECSVAFTGHAVIATSVPAEEVRALGPDGYGGSLAPDFLCRLAGPGGWINGTDVMLVARGTGGSPGLAERRDRDDHPRVRHARGIRTDVRVYGDERGFLTLASGLAGRLELSIELEQPGLGSRGLGRSLLLDALALVPAGAPVFAAVAPGNARSLRSFLAAGFVPMGSEVLMRPARAAVTA